MPAGYLWREWLQRFDGNADLALGRALNLADRLAQAHSEKKKREELRRIKRAILGDAFAEPEHSEPLGPEERARLPLPFIGLLRALKHVAWRAGFRPWKT
jgi:hypothetical protein